MKRFRIDSQARTDLDEIYEYIYFRPVRGGIQVARVIRGARDITSEF